MNYFYKWLYWKSEENDVDGFVYFTDILRDESLCGWTFHLNRLRFSPSLAAAEEWDVVGEKIPNLSDLNRRDMVMDCFERIKKGVDW